MATIKGLIRHLKIRHLINSPFLATIRTAKLNVLKREYISGDKTALIDTLKMYTDIDRTEMPDWVAKAVSQALYKWRECEVRTLDEAFEVERPKSFNLNAARRKRAKVFEVHDEATILREAVPMGEEFWELLAKACDMKAGTARDYYYIAEHERNPKDIDSG